MFLEMLNTSTFLYVCITYFSVQNDADVADGVVASLPGPLDQATVPANAITIRLVASNFEGDNSNVNVAAAAPMEEDRADNDDDDDDDDREPFPQDLDR